MVSSPGFVSNMRHFVALFRLGFPSLSLVYSLCLPRTLTRWLILLKARRQYDAIAPYLRPVVSTQFQILFHSPRRGPFHLSLTVLLLYRSSRVFSLGGWAHLLPTILASIVVLRILVRFARLRLRGSHPLRPTFPDPSPSARIALPESYNPACRNIRFGLLRFRSPLLAESSLFLVLLRCFSSDGSPRFSAMTRFYPRRVSPFGHLRLSRSYTPHRSFSQYNTPFFGTRCLGILCVPLLAFRTQCTESPALLARAFLVLPSRFLFAFQAALPTTFSPQGLLVCHPCPLPSRAFFANFLNWNFPQRH